MRAPIFVVASAMALGACSSAKKQVVADASVNYDRRMETMSVLRDSSTHSMALALDSPEIVIFRPLDSVFVAVRARRVAIKSDTQQNTAVVDVVTDTTHCVNTESLRQTECRLPGSGFAKRALIIMALSASLFLIYSLRKHKKL